MKIAERWSIAASCIGVACLIGCAAQSRQPLDRAEMAYRDASSDPAVQENAPVALHDAEEALERAQAEWDDGDEEEAVHLAYVSERRSEAAIAEAAAREKKEKVKVEIFKKTDRGLVLTLEDVLFEFDKANLKPGGKRRLDEVVQFVREHPDKHVMIEGHTDSIGSDGYNRQLSRARAESVESYLMRQGISVSRLHARGYGEEYPVASNDTAAGRQQNRRVELVITDEDRVVWR